MSDEIAEVCFDKGLISFGKISKGVVENIGRQMEYQKGGVTENKAECEERLRLMNRIEVFLMSKSIQYRCYYSCGMPDILASVYGVLCAIMIKCSTGSLTELQDKSLRDIELSRGLPIVLYSDDPDDFEFFKKVVENIRGRSSKQWVGVRSKRTAG